MALNAVAWREDAPEDDVRTYKMQISDVSKRSANKLLREMKDWRSCGDGVNTRSKKLLFLFVRDFASEKEWLEWAKTFSYPLQEINSRGRAKKIKSAASN